MKYRKGCIFMRFRTLILSGVFSVALPLSLMAQDTTPQIYTAGMIHYQAETKLMLDQNNRPINGVAQNFYANGKLSDEAMFTNGKQNDLARSYYENGQIKKERTYVNGVLEGPYKDYDEQGNILTEGVLKNAQLNGLIKDFYPQAKLKREANYENNILNGVYKEYYESGKIKLRQTLKTVNKTVFLKHIMITDN